MSRLILSQCVARPVVVGLLRRLRRLLVGGDSGGRLHAFRSLAGNRALVRVLAGYALFVLTEYSAWIAVLVFAYSRGGATVAGLVAVAQLVPAAVLAPVMAAVADPSSTTPHRRPRRNGDSDRPSLPPLSPGRRLLADAGDRG